ncbi:Wzz/FepE/Etk N-terminal domain-containing protein [Streptomyces sp. NPDC088785]|uniref:Wzz/FepE/Etk N-terminal domain-containing protein n=1 Tax=Streptomyces sp. NPDC088785 TaxID=3365897 RepID=UPI0037FD53D7
MNEDTIRLATIGRMLRRRWRLLAALAVLGALVGYGTSLVFPPRYTTTASVLLPGQWEERELLTQVDIATSSTVLDLAADKLHWSDVTGTDLQDRVVAKAADGNIIKISGTADTPKHAQQLADRTAEQFVVFAKQIAGGSADTEAATLRLALRKQVEAANRRITELARAADPGQTVEGVEARTSLEKLRTSLEEAMTKLDQADPTSNTTGMVVMGPSARPVGEAAPTRAQLIGAGALVFLLAAVIGHLAAARMNRRPRTDREIATALGADLIGTVDVPDDRHAHRPQDDGTRARIGRFLGTDVRWDTPAPQRSGDEAGRRIRYRRVCARLRDRSGMSPRLLAVVPDGDAIAQDAAGQLVAEATADPAAGALGGGHPLLTVAPVSVDRPMVPDRASESGALIVVSAGTWTAAELSGIARACADGGHEIVGLVIAEPVLAGPGRSAAHPPHHAAPAPAVHSHATGGSA